MVNDTDLQRAWNKSTADWVMDLTSWDKIFAVISIGFVTLLAILINSTWQPAYPKGAPKLIRGWPVFGALHLFGARKTFLMDSMRQSLTGNISTYIGKYQVIGLSGARARKFNFESKGLSLIEGCNALLSGTVSPLNPVRIGDKTEDFHTWSHRTLIKLMQKEYFARTLPGLVSDASDSLSHILKRGEDKETDIIDPFDDIYKIVYQLTMRTVGASEITNDARLRGMTLSLFREIEHGSSPMRIMFPWLPTLGRIRQTVAGVRMFLIFGRIAKQRKSGRRQQDDAFQYLVETGADTTSIISCTIATIFAGLVNSGPNAAWLLAFLANNKVWYRRVRSEIDASLRRHRTSTSQTVVEVLQTLTVDDWEAEFPSIDLALRETVRFTAVGTAYRRNISGKDLPIADSGEILPSGAFTLYPIDDIHMDPAVYTNPTEFDPGRYLSERAEDRKTPFGYLGFGAGRHSCIGMRFAKLEIGIITAIFAATFDWELVDAHGASTRLPDSPGPGGIDRDNYIAHEPPRPIRLRYTVRQHEEVRG